MGEISGRRQTWTAFAQLEKMYDGYRFHSNSAPAYRYIFAHEGSSYETYIRLMTLHQRKVLGALASVGGAHVNSNDFLDAAGCHNASSVKKALERLVDVGHVYQFKGAWKFASPFFCEWMRRRA